MFSSAAEYRKARAVAALLVQNAAEGETIMSRAISGSWTTGCAASQQDAATAGGLVYQHTCAMCHDHGEALRAPTLATLKGMRYQQIYYALTVGKMQAQGQSLAALQRS